MMALEPRLLFDGAAALAVVGALKASTHAADQGHGHDGADGGHSSRHGFPGPWETAVVTAGDSSKSDGKREIVFVDSNVESWRTLVKDAPAGAEVVLFNGNGNGLKEIADFLSKTSGVDAVYIVSHGASGELALGSAIVTDANLDGYKGDLATIGAALKPGGDILLYGCDVGQGQTGTTFISDLAAATGDVIAASTNLTGSAALGGDWVLETSTGVVAVAGLQAPDYGGVLALPNFSENFTTETGVSGNWTYVTSQTSGTWSGLVNATDGVELTQAALNERGILVYNSTFSGVNGFDIKFTYSMVKGTSSGADGLAFCLLNGSLAVPNSPGVVGGGLGYTSITGGVLGIGFDEYGNFSTSGAGSNSPTGGHTATYEGDIVLRGSTTTSSTTNNRYETAVQPNSSGAPQSPGSGSATYIEGTHSVEVILFFNNANSHYLLTVKLDGVAEISNYDVTAAGITIPSTLRFGFTASTGGSDSLHSIENVSVTVPTLETGVSASSWTGTSAADIAKTATADNTPTLTGTSAANSTVYIYVDGVLVGNAAADVNGDWSYSISSALSDGTHTLTATNSLSATASASYSLNVDTPPLVSGADGAGVHTDSNDLPVITGSIPTATAGAAITVYSDGVVLGTTTTSASGGWSYAVGTALADGSHTITATETLGGVTSAAASGYALAITTAPSVASVDGTAGSHADDVTTPGISGVAASGTSVGSAIEVYVDGSLIGTTVTTDTAGHWSLTPATSLAPGSHTITATETMGGLTSSLSSAYALTIYAPPIVSGITAASYTGTSAADIANTATANAFPTITGTSAAGATVTVYANGVSLGTAIADLTGAWRLTSGTSLLYGGNSLTSIETIDGFTSSASVARTLVVDKAPTVTSIDGVAGQHSDANATPSISGTVADGVLAGSMVSVSIDGTLVGTTTSDATGTWSFALGSTLGEGNHTVTATTTSGGIVSGVSSGYALAVTSAPTVTSIDGTAGRHGDANATPTIGGTAAAGTPAGSAVSVFIDGTLVGTTTSDAAGAWSYGVGSALADGGHTVTASETVGGVTSTVSTGYTLVVTTAPTVTSIDGTVGSHGGSDTTPAIGGVSAAGTPAGSVVGVFIDGALVGTTATDAAGAWSYRVGSALADGDHTVTASETVGGVVSTASAGYALSVTAAPMVTSIDGTVGRHGDANATPTIGGTAAAGTPAGSAVSVFIDGTLVGTTTSDAAGAWSYGVGSALADGGHTVTASETVGGVTSTVSTGYTLVVTTAPTVTSIDGTVGSHGGSDTTPAIGGVSAAGTPAGSVVGVFIDGALAGAAATDAAGAWSYRVGSALANGGHTVTASETVGGVTSTASTGYALSVIAPPSVTAIGGIPGLHSRGGAAAAPVVSGVTATGTPAGSVVSIYVDGVFVGTTVSDFSGGWSYDLGTGLGVGMHTIAAAESMGGMTSPISAAYTLMMEAVPVTTTADKGPGESGNPPVSAPDMAAGGIPEVPRPDTSSELVTIVHLDSGVEAAVLGRPSHGENASPVGQSELVTAPTVASTPLLPDEAASARTALLVAGTTPYLTVSTVDGFQIVVVKDIGVASGGLFVLKTLGEAEPTVKGDIRYAVGVDTFGHTDPTAVVALSASLADGSALPKWLEFNPHTGTFRGAPPADVGAGAFLVRVTAMDNEGRSAVAWVRISLDRHRPADHSHARGAALEEGGHGTLLWAARSLQRDWGGYFFKEAEGPVASGLTARLRDVGQREQLARDAAVLRAAARMMG